MLNKTCVPLKFKRSNLEDASMIYSSGIACKSSSGLAYMKQQVLSQHENVFDRRELGLISLWHTGNYVYINQVLNITKYDTMKRRGKFKCVQMLKVFISWFWAQYNLLPLPDSYPYVYLYSNHTCPPNMGYNLTVLFPQSWELIIIVVLIITVKMLTFHSRDQTVYIILRMTITFSTN